MKKVTVKKTQKRNYNVGKEDKFINRIIQLIESLKDEEWQTFHKEIHFDFPINALTNKRYKGVNLIILLLDIISNKFIINKYLTFNQISKLNGKLRRGSQGVPIEFFTPIYKHKENDSQIKEDEFLNLNDQEKKKYTKRNILRTYYVFNISQIENFEEFKINLEEEVKNNYSNDVEVNTNFEEIVNRLCEDKNLIINEILQGRAFYNFDLDEVFLPKKELFKSSKEYYSTLFHELIHWTGNVNRLNRPMQGMNEKSKYAFEELIAEIGSLIINLNNQDLSNFNNSIIYLKGWLKYTEKEEIENTLRKAFIESQKAVSYILY